MQAQFCASCRLDAHRLGVVKLPRTTAPNHQVAIAVFHQPIQIRLRGNPRIHDHQSPRRGLAVVLPDDPRLQAINVRPQPLSDYEQLTAKANPK